jgi:micrococcal nuclease
VERVIDGDTLVLEGGTRVRLLGLDAPEVGYGGKEPEYFAPASKAFLEQLVQKAGGELRLEYDRVRIDMYGRTLAYLWNREGGFLNEIILLEGYAVFYEGDALRWRERLRLAAEEARRNQRGLWHPGAPP